MVNILFDEKIKGIKSTKSSQKLFQCTNWKLEMFMDNNIIIKSKSTWKLSRKYQCSKQKRTIQTDIILIWFAYEIEICNSPFQFELLPLKNNKANERFVAMVTLPQIFEKNDHADLFYENLFLPYIGM